MKFGITAKLFLVILAANAAIAIAVSFGERLSFDRGFREYMRERESDRLAGLAETLAAAWRTEGSFQFLRGNELLWQRFARGGRDFGGPPPRGGSGGERPFDHSGPPPEGREGFRELRPPPPFGGRPPPPRETTALPALLDAQQRSLVGTRSASRFPWSNRHDDERRQRAHPDRGGRAQAGPTARGLPASRRLCDALARRRTRGGKRGARPCARAGAARSHAARP